MADVYLAKQVGLEGFEKLIVIKTMLPLISASPELRDMFIAEAKTAVNLQHPNVVQILDLGLLDNRLFIAMEYVEGTDLRRAMVRALEANLALSVEVAVYIVIEVLKALEHAHTSLAEPVIHRDVSPSNVLLSNAGEVKLADFGIARSTLRQEQTRSGIVVGKLPYMAPERLQHGTSGPGSDVYSTGLVLHELLSGRHPLAGETDGRMALRIRRGDLPRPSAYNTRVPPALDAIVVRATARDLQERYASAHEMVDDLEAYADRENLKLRPKTLKAWLDAIAQERSVTTPSSLWATLGPLVSEGTSAGVTVLRAHSASGASPVGRDPIDIADKGPMRLEPLARWSVGEGSISALTFDPQGNHVATGGNLGSLSMWNWETRKRVTELHGHAERISGVHFLPTNMLLTSSFDRTLKLWDLQSHRPVWTLEGHDSWVLSSAVAPDAVLAASGSWDRLVKLWSISKGQEVATLHGHEAGITALAFSPDSMLIVSGDTSGMLWLWEVFSGEDLGCWQAHTGAVTSVAFVPGTDRVVSAGDDGSLRIWDLLSARELGALDAHSNWVNAVVVSPTSEVALSAGEDGSVRVWDLDEQQTAQTLHLPPSDGAARSLAVSASGKYIAIGTELGTLHAMSLTGA